jgi:hypothetical protein
LFFSPSTSFREVLAELSPHLRGTLAQHCYGPAISSVPFFNIDLKRVPEVDRPEAEMEHNLWVQQVRRLMRTLQHQHVP